ncbi:unnamed protein product [Somion occarium]|uniref:Uncharacterized protein n=1 Tax=Somion occarium TaxID=3059160 RepID=A0ABP1E8N7_9APHY
MSRCTQKQHAQPTQEPPQIVFQVVPAPSAAPPPTHVPSRTRPKGNNAEENETEENETEENEAEENIPKGKVRWRGEHMHHIFTWFCNNPSEWLRLFSDSLQVAKSEQHVTVTDGTKVQLQSLYLALSKFVFTMDSDSRESDYARWPKWYVKKIRLQVQDCKRKYKKLAAKFWPTGVGNTLQQAAQNPNFIHWKWFGDFHELWKGRPNLDSVLGDSTPHQSLAQTAATEFLPGSSHRLGDDYEVDGGLTEAEEDKGVSEGNSEDEDEDEGGHDFVSSGNSVHDEKLVPGQLMAASLWPSTAGFGINEDYSEGSFNQFNVQAARSPGLPANDHGALLSFNDISLQIPALHNKLAYTFNCTNSANPADPADPADPANMFINTLSSYNFNNFFNMDSLPIEDHSINNEGSQLIEHTSHLGTFCNHDIITLDESPPAPPICFPSSSFYQSSIASNSSSSFRSSANPSPSSYSAASLSSISLPFSQMQIPTAGSGEDIASTPLSPISMSDGSLQTVPSSMDTRSVLSLLPTQPSPSPSAMTLLLICPTFALECFANS